MKMIHRSENSSGFFYIFHEESFYGILMLVVGFIAIILVVCFIVKLCFCGDDDDGPNKEPRNYPGTMIFAHEVTPGTVVLQSANGEYFRILHEYSSSQNAHTGLNGACSSSQDVHASSAVYNDRTFGVRRIEHAHSQTRPSAPPLGENALMASCTPVMLQPPPYSESFRLTN